MAKATVFSGEVLHFGAVRLRVNGSGNLQSQLSSLDGVKTSQLANIAMQSSTDKEPTLLANFSNQRAQLYCTVGLIDEIFTISKIVFFIKPIYGSYPQ